MEKLPSGSPSLDRLLHGGLSPSQLTLFYGEAGSGKTVLALQFSLQAARMGRQVVYVDADGEFPAERVRRMGVEAERLLPSIGLFTPRNFYEQTILIENFDRILPGKTGLLVFDTINSLYRLAAANPEITTPANKELNRQLAYLARIARTFNIPVLLTSQVRGVLADEDLQAEKVEPVASRILRFWCSNIVQLRRTGKPNVKAAFLEVLKGREKKGVFCHFRVTDWGVE
ncbi:MAG: hypothetical protein DRO46_02675 [Candidatus Hecatellales archaeon]|nr:MAG: hypothetical protein DRO46_02675 [Candidatus Hecatellales archaeon]